MLDNSKPQKLECTCPSGHKLRGDVELIGELVECPACDVRFVFGIQANDGMNVSDTAVMRILGDVPASKSKPTETPVTQPCRTCGSTIDESASVCHHCNSYVAILPGFLQSMMKAAKNN
ncbi:MAG: hypothetical protein HKN47_15420 [Pirellulaceae bacterium]|nr:hypothetical protein [Pirellulaceae bacterium]